MPGLLQGSNIHLIDYWQYQNVPYVSTMKALDKKKTIPQFCNRMLSTLWNNSAYLDFIGMGWILQQIKYQIKAECDFNFENKNHKNVSSKIQW